MKNPIFQKSLLFLGVLVLLASCKKDDSNTTASFSTSTSSFTKINLPSGKWKITYYNDNGTDETADYTGYEFQFNSSGSVSATNGANSVTGSWSSGTDDDQLKLILDFPTSNSISELNDDWHIVEQSSSKVKLEDISGGGGGTDYLTFEKI
jgi:hypothetical protein